MPLENVPSHNYRPMRTFPSNGQRVWVLTPYGVIKVWAVPGFNRSFAEGWRPVTEPPQSRRKQSHAA